jgi:ABC-type nitrate/sulfonate/bicarbonate transport system permease component
MENFQIDLLWATALLSAAMSLAVFGILRAVERYVNRWFA